MKTTYLISTSTLGAKIFSVIVVAGLMAGCASDGSFSGMEGLRWFDSSEPVQTVVLARDPASLAGGSQVERIIHDAVELTRQKRFSEALCDGARANGKPCDKRLCARCRNRHGPDVDYCPTHNVVNAGE